ncbi:MAG TPA: ABC transporter substrate-binding protein [Pyrinomonadaceae bacterium]|jgi:peptide/nickel transport system substrate-binding protein
MKLSVLQRIFLTLVMLAFALSAGACLQQTEQTATNTNASQTGLARERVTGTSGGTLSYRLSAPPKTFNPIMVADEPSFTLAFILLGARLVDYDHDAQRYAPSLAESWQLTGDGRTVDLTLRDGLKFSDGHPLTTEDVLFTLRAIYDESTASIFRTTMTIGGRQIEASASDARRMRFVFPEVVAAPETYLVNLAVLPKHLLEEDLKRGAMGRESFSISTEPARIVTAGPFTVEAVTPGERITLKRNPHFWKKDGAGNQLPYLERIVVEVVGDQNAAVTRVKEGALDIVDRIRPTDYAALQQAGTGAVRAYDLGPGLSTDYIWFNLNEGERDGKPIVDASKRAWFADERFRRAVAHAIDRETIASTTLQGLATPLYGYVSPGNRAWVASDVPRTEYNLERARALLSEAGFKTGGTKEAPELTDAKGNAVGFTLILQTTNEERKAEAAVIQEDLARLGIRMQIAPVETSEVVRRALQSFDYDAVLLGATVSDTDPSSYSNLLNSSSDNHQWYPKQAKPATPWEARIDELVVALSRETDVEKRRAVFRDIQLTIAEHMPVIPIVARHIVCAANTRIGNYRPSVVVPYSLWNVEELFIKK